MARVNLHRFTERGLLPAVGRPRAWRSGPLAVSDSYRTVKEPNASLLPRGISTIDVRRHCLPSVLADYDTAEWLRFFDVRYFVRRCYACNEWLNRRWLSRLWH